jgi:hypothetical protein
MGLHSVLARYAASRDARNLESRERNPCFPAADRRVVEAAGGYPLLLTGLTLEVRTCMMQLEHATIRSDRAVLVGSPFFAPRTQDGPKLDRYDRTRDQPLFSNPATAGTMWISCQIQRHRLISLCPYGS